MNQAGTPRSLTFSWEQVRRIPLVLPALVLVSALGHFGAFFLFQVVYPPQASINAPHPSLTLADPRRPDHQALLRWIDAEDPAPASTGVSSITDRLLDLPYRPSYATMRTMPLPVPEPPPTILFPPARDPLAIIRSVEAKATPAPPPSPVKPTRVVFSPEFAGRVPRSLPPLTMTTRVSKAVDAAEFLIGVSDRGEVRFIFLQRASADVDEAAALDAEAADRLMRVKLDPGPAELTWGRARIEWGPDIYAEPGAAKKTPTAKARQ
jgi:hypothetical protein